MSFEDFLELMTYSYTWVCDIKWKGIANTQVCEMLVGCIKLKPKNIMDILVSLF